MDRNEKERRVISVGVVRTVLLNMGVVSVNGLTDEEIGENTLSDLGLVSYELPEFLERIEKDRRLFLDKEAITDFLQNGYSRTVYELGEFSANHFSTVKPIA